MLNSFIMMKKQATLIGCLLTFAAIGNVSACAGDSLQVHAPAVIKADPDNAGLTLPAGFGALTVAENTGRPRHIVVTPQGDVYVKLNRSVNGKGILRLRDTNGDGKADQTVGFGDYGGTGIAIKNGYLYASSDQAVYRYKLNDKNEVVNPNAPEELVSGLKTGEHPMKSIALDNDNHLYVNMGAYSNSCQEQDRTKGSKGLMPCPVLNDAAGIWQFSADKQHQTQAEGIRYATGLRNVVGIAWNQLTNTLFVMQHGRDQLYDNWPEYFTEQQSAELPAECMYELHKGDNAGWPYIFYDQIQHKKILAPEYGGDGKKEGGKDAIDPVAAYPGHMAPDGLLFYTGNMFPEKYRNGAFIAFHGSWNRAPLPQEGYFVVFQPFSNGKPSGKWEVFAKGFAGVNEVKNTRDAQHRPCGLAQGPDGSLYVTDDTRGTIYRIIYKGK